MKKLPIAAAALLLGTSAYAFAPSTGPADGVQHPHIVAPTSAGAPVYDEAPALQPTAVGMWMTAEPVAATAGDNRATLKTAAEAKTVAMADQAAEVDALLAAHENAAADAQEAMDTAVAREAKLNAELVDSAAAVRPASLETGFGADETVTTETAAMTGMGGPDEAVETAAADLTPRPAAQNYPACRPGPGDDNCIQLYEPGVRQQLASWTQPTGGFTGSAGTQVAMGGPYEPVDDAAMAQESAVVGDGIVDTARGETPADEDVVEV